MVIPEQNEGLGAKSHRIEEFKRLSRIKGLGSAKAQWIAESKRLHRIAEENAKEVPVDFTRAENSM